MYQCFSVLPIEVVLMMVIFLQLAYTHEPKVQVSFEVEPLSSSIGKAIRFVPMGLCNPLCNFATTFV